MTGALDALHARQAERVWSSSPQARAKHGPPADEDWRRVWSLPRRQDYDVDRLVDRYTERFAIGDQRLRPVQAVALYEIETYGSFVGAYQVGAGKTLVTLLAPWVYGGDRLSHLLVVPAKLERKTQEERVGYGQHWRLPESLHVMSIERLARVNQAEFLDAHRPKLIMIDEAHRLANRKSSATKRIQRYLDEHPDTRVVVLTGTLGSRDVGEFAHLVRWALRDGAPVPRRQAAVALWSQALAEPPKAALGAFGRFGGIDGARAALRDRLVSTPGMHSTTSQHESPLEVVMSDLRPSDECMAFLRRATDAWVLPDGQPIDDPIAMSRHAYTIALGFWLRWRLPGPESWMHARRQWSAYVRGLTNRVDSEWDTEEHVRRGVESGDLPDGEDTLQSWLSVRDSFVPETEVCWIDDSVVDLLVEWARESPGVVWYRHTAMADALLRRGIRVYGRRGEDASGRHVMHHPADQSCAASRMSSGEGVNLQQMCRALVLEPMGKAAPWEQLIGRMHRPGQSRPVRYEIYCPTDYHRRAVQRAEDSAAWVESTLGQRQKIIQGKMK